jgi:hypothetical protein
MTSHETLDEAIDRVAASMTMVSGDVTLSSRVRAGMANAKRSGAVWGFVVAGSIAAAVLAIVVMDQRGAPIASGTNAPGVTAVDPPRVLQSSRGAEPITQPVQRELSSDSTIAVRRDAPEPSIPALALPEALNLEGLEMQSLSIAPVELDLLEVATLAVSEIDGSLDPKE